MFRGDTPLNLDAKGRLAIPSRYRERLMDVCGGSLVTTISLTHRCLTVYPFPEWKRIEDDIQKLPTFDKNAQAIRHLLIGRASETDMDGHGRILVSPSLREWAGLDKRVRMVGQVQKFELWDQDAWLEHFEKLHAPSADVLDERSEILSSLVL